MSDTFHDVRFPTDVARGATGGPVRRTEVVTLASGKEQRNTRWKHARRTYNAGYGIKTVDDLNTVIAFFEERRGRLHGFRFHDPVDFKSCKPGDAIAATDQVIGQADGASTKFQLVKRYGEGASGYERPITKPVTGSVVVAIDGNTIENTTHYDVDHLTGEVIFSSGHIPANGTIVTAGFEFDVPVRFDADEITVNLKAFNAGDIPSIPLVEVR